MSPALLASLIVTLAAIVALAVWTGAHNTKKKGEGKAKNAAASTDSGLAGIADNADNPAGEGKE